MYRRWMDILRALPGCLPPHSPISTTRIRNIQCIQLVVSFRHGCLHENLNDAHPFQYLDYRRALSSFMSPTSRSNVPNLIVHFIIGSLWPNTFDNTKHGRNFVSVIGEGKHPCEDLAAIDSFTDVSDIWSHTSNRVIPNAKTSEDLDFKAVSSITSGAIHRIDPATKLGSGAARTSVREIDSKPKSARRTDFSSSIRTFAY